MPWAGSGVHERDRQSADVAPNSLHPVPSMSFGGSASYMAGYGATSASGGPNAQEDHFSIASARSYLFSKLPAAIRAQVSYRHFYTEELDVGISPDKRIHSSVLSVKFFGALLMYLCSLFKLEGRRKQYETAHSEKAGREFAAAHQRTQEVFEFLSNCYSIILTTYNCHSELVYQLKLTPQLKLQLSKTGPQAVGMKAPLPTVKKVLAFTYRSDELRFYEELFTMAEDMVKLAFHADETLKTHAVQEVNRLFRSNSFRFLSQQRENEVKAKANALDRRTKGILHNNRRVVELLQPAIPPIVIKYALQQRTALVGAKFPGGTSYMKYQRVRKEGERTEPSILEKTYNVETDRVNFASNHPAMSEVAARKPGTSSSGRGISFGDRRRTTMDVLSSNVSMNSGDFTNAFGVLRSPGNESLSRLSDRSARGSGPKYLAGLKDYDHPSAANEFLETTSSASSPPTGVPGNVRAGSIVTEISVRHHDKKLVGERRFPVGRIAKQVGSAQAVVSEIQLRVDAHNVAEATRSRRERIAVSNGRTASTIPPKASPPKAATKLAPLRRKLPAEREEDRLNLHNLPDTLWLNYNPQPDIEAILESMKYGVEAPTFRLPSDLMVQYDERGVYLPPNEWQPELDVSPPRGRSR